MPHAWGSRARTRKLFSKPFRGHGIIPISRYLTNYKIGDFVDVLADSAVQKGMPHKYYHGNTGRVFNVTKRAVGVVVNKKVGTRVEPKRINLRIEHIRLSQTREAFKARCKTNDLSKAAANKAGKPISTKRSNLGPRLERVVVRNVEEFETFNPLRFKEVY
jgi:large subunit ribosomal protein L21e